MSSKEYEVETTVTIAGNEQNVTVRASVNYEPIFGGGMGGVIDGDIEAMIDGKWVDVDSLGLDKSDTERVNEVLVDACNEDDGCLDADDFDDRMSA